MLIFCGTSLCYVDSVKLRLGCLASNRKDFKAFFLVIFFSFVYLLHIPLYISIFCFWRILVG